MKKSSANIPGEEYIANLPSVFKPMCSLPVLNNFLDYKLSFIGMADVVRATMEELTSKNLLSSEVELEAVMEIDMQARSVAKTFVEKI